MTQRRTARAYDPDELARALARMFEKGAPIGFIIGRTLLCDAVSQLLECSRAEAEQAIDTLILRGRLAFTCVPRGSGVWSFRLPARA